MRSVCLLWLFACTAFAQKPAAEPRTWTFRQDGRIETQSGVWTFKKGGRVEGRFVRLSGSNVLVVKLALNGREGRLNISSLSDEDCFYLAGVTGQPIAPRPKSETPAPRLKKDQIEQFVETKFDAATAQTTYQEKHPIKLGPANDPRMLNMQAYILANIPEFVAFHVISRCPAALGWQYSTDRRVSFLWEDGKKDLTEAKHFGMAGDGFLLEQFTPRCKFSEFKEIASAKQLELHLGHEIFKLPYESRAAWRALVALLETQPANEY